ncbi:L-lysine 2,3-aminomutase [Halioglobus japonicus]|nr:L-lysine 2,3-aminomutase [Halioglobus japonicus]
MPVTTQLIHTTADWQQQLRDVITSRDALLGAVGLSATDVGHANGACEDFAVKVPRSFVQRMRHGDPRDPLLLQVLSSPQEMVDEPGFVRDPVGENGATIPHRGIIHKYHGRVLLIVSGGCAVNCRYCFRRHFPYNENQNSRAQWREALQLISDDDSIEEVILSGGDPLVVTDEQLQQLVMQIGAIPHVKRLRIHTRLPVVIPERVTGALLDAITLPHLQTVMVIHCNHAAEIDDAVAASLSAVRQRGITLLNQSVLLAGINDSVQAQLDLCQRLFSAGTLPYYLHLLDKVQGAAHFDVPEQLATKLVEKMTQRLPGYLVPKLVREIAGEASKTGVS